jgi:hypothetical protein
LQIMILTVSNNAKKRVPGLTSFFFKADQNFMLFFARYRKPVTDKFYIILHDFIK